MTPSTYSPAKISAEGRHARERGDPVTANPYPAGSDPHRTWERGYRTPDAEARDTSAAATDGGADPAES
ncbi:Rmf/CrpP family protein [Methylobacterium sp. J-070]|uniref:ribosome modulation factor n=1 Tax=Methylobacterium sp. J-070 TaxID=2836650 RepID=UPI001FBAF7F1|nr:Rmf/CrpP family protein [Methylobacterium sp. J-070]MCJ2051174.1 hypothetical protein [Methylobacterium sp. J-070]